MFFCTDRRIILIDKNFEKFQDIEYSHISSIKWTTHYNENYLSVGAVGIIIGVILFLIESSLKVSQLKIYGIASLIVGVFFIILYVTSEKKYLFLMTEQEKIPFIFTGGEPTDTVTKVSKIIRGFGRWTYQV